MADPAAGDFVLGIDLGTNSLGWAMVGLVDGEPATLLRTGSRVFEAGMDETKGLGKEESRNKARRDARLHRRQLWRHRRRLLKLAHILQRPGLLPEGDVSDPEARQDFFNRLDAEILASPWFAVKEKSGFYHEPRQVMPYILRAAALNEPLQAHFLGRALYHLGQRRGFLSNRKQVAKKKDDDEGKVKEGIAELRKAMQENHVRTLGEYLSRLSPSEQRIRSRWTARDMYEKEFDAIWAAQAKHQPDLPTEERRKELRRAIFYQRPLWFDPNTVGQCELEPGQPRAPRSSFVAQRFRLLQAVNNLRLESPDRSERSLTLEERAELVQELELKGDRTFAQTRKLLKLPKEARFTIEHGGEKTLHGNRTTAAFCGVFGEQRWLEEMSAEEHQQALEDLLSIQKEDALWRRAINHWKLDEESAKKLASISPETDYFNLSRKAIEKLLPLLEVGVSYAEARKQIYPESFESTQPKPLLPPVEQALTEIRNPAVMRSLTELRKVTNALVRAHGRPVEIHIELARDLKKSKKQREAISQNNRRNEKDRAEAAKKIIAEAGIAQPKPDDLRKFLLAKECRWECPYTGMSISMHSLFGPEAQFDIEHIIPFSRSMDNSFSNLTLCYVPENRAVKGNKTPFQAYSGDEARYGQILDRVKRFTGERRTVAAKLKRFSLSDEELEAFLEDFRNRQLNDTAYATSLAAKYLGLLYGGVNDAEGKKRIQATSGQTTSYFRNLWKLNSILNDGPSKDGGYRSKSREDHRHHAVDAVVIGLTDAGMIKRLSDAAQRAPHVGHKRFAPIEGPWPNFVDSVRAEIDKIVVSHRVSKKVSGALHEETIYSRRFGAGENSEVRVRKPLSSVTKSELDDIADEGVKKLVLARLESVGGGDPKKVFADEKNQPFFETEDGRRIPIKRVRLKKKTPTVTLGKNRQAREVTPGSNHHIEIFAELDEHGEEIEWDGQVVSMYEAYQRKKAGRPIVQKDLGANRRFKFSLAADEAVECDGPGGSRSLFVFRKVSHLSSGQIQMGFAPINDARKAREMQISRGWLWCNPNTLGGRHARKVLVSPLGEVCESHD